MEYSESLGHGSASPCAILQSGPWVAQHSAAHPSPCFCLCYNLGCSSVIPPSFFLPLPPVFRRYITLAAKGYSFSSLFHFYERSLLYPQPGSLSGKPIYDFMISFLCPPFPRKGSLPSLLFALPPPLSLSKSFGLDLPCLIVFLCGVTVLRRLVCSWWCVVVGPARTL